MDIRQIEYFNAVVACGSFTGAAANMHISQPAITTAIKTLEEELGVKLFIRDRRSIILTPEGQRFRDRTLSLLGQFEDLKTDMLRLADSRGTRLNIAVIPVGGAGVTTALHSGFHRTYPNYELSVYELGTLACINALEQNEVDLAFMVLTDECRIKFNVLPIHSSTINAVVCRDNPLSRREKLTAQDLKNEPVILLPEHTIVSQQVNRMFASANISPNVIATPSQMFTVFSLVMHDAGISFVLGDGFSFALDTDKIVAVPLEPALPYELGFVWKKDAFLNAAARDCIKYTQDTIKEPGK